MTPSASCIWLHAPQLFCASSSAPPSKLNCSPSAMVTSVRIAIVGDVHDDWNLEEDDKALKLLKPDLVLFTGDFGNENVELVRTISNLEFAKAVILGNHDAWRTQKFSTREKDSVQLQFESLGDEHVGYGRMDFPSKKLSVVGGRPFSCGGDHFYRKRLLVSRYGVHNMDESAQKIYEAALGSPAKHSIVFLAHNGPTGLGSNVDDICGRDWSSNTGGDHGDPDLARAISQLKENSNLSIILVVFGHMHKKLARGKGVRKMMVVGNDNTVYLNGAIVPRVKKLLNSGATIRAFTVVDLIDGKLETIAETWVSVVGDKVALENETVLFKTNVTKL